MLKVFNQVSSHGAEDLQKVTKIAKDRVEKYGTEKLTWLFYGLIFNINPLCKKWSSCLLGCKDRFYRKLQDKKQFLITPPYGT